MPQSSKLPAFKTVLILIMLISLPTTYLQHVESQRYAETDSEEDAKPLDDSLLDKKIQGYYDNDQFASKSDVAEKRAQFMEDLDSAMVTIIQEALYSETIPSVVQTAESDSYPEIHMEKSKKAAKEDIEDRLVKKDDVVTDNFATEHEFDNALFTENLDSSNLIDFDKDNLVKSNSIDAVTSTEGTESSLEVKMNEESGTEDTLASTLVSNSNSSTVLSDSSSTVYILTGNSKTKHYLDFATETEASIGNGITLHNSILIDNSSNTTPLTKVDVSSSENLKNDTKQEDKPSLRATTLHNELNAQHTEFNIDYIIKELQRYTVSYETTYNSIPILNTGFNSSEKHVSLPEGYVNNYSTPRAPRILRKERNVTNFHMKDIKTETKQWKTDLKTGNLKLVPENLNLDPKFGSRIESVQNDPQSACARKNTTCEACKAISPYCHYNFTGKYCFYSKYSHENDVYECGVRFVPIDGYSPVMTSVMVLVVVSALVCAYFVRSLVKIRASAALPEEEVAAMREQVQFVRDRWTSK